MKGQRLTLISVKTSKTVASRWEASEARYRSPSRAGAEFLSCEELGTFLLFPEKASLVHKGFNTAQEAAPTPPSSVCRAWGSLCVYGITGLPGKFSIRVWKPLSWA